MLGGKVSGTLLKYEDKMRKNTPSHIDESEMAGETDSGIISDRIHYSSFSFVFQRRLVYEILKNP